MPEEKLMRMPMNPEEEMNMDEEMESEESEMGSELEISEDQLPEVADWKDGEMYEVTLRQISKGKFEVVDAGEIEEEESEESGSGEEEKGQESENPSSY